MRPTKENLKKNWLPIAIVACFAASIGLLMFLDYFNLEKIAFFNNAGFLFQITWKGRMFLLFFLALFALETFLAVKQPKQEASKPRRKIKTAAILICALIPLIYIIAINYLGLDQVVIRAGELIRLDYWKSHSSFWNNSLYGDWTLSLEYVVFSASFIAVTLLAYGKKSVKAFGLTAALIVGVAMVYMIDTMYPFGAFGPLQAFVLPTTACAAGVMDLMKIPFSMVYSPSFAATPLISVTVNGVNSTTSVAWPCSGVHDLFFYAAFILVFFWKTNISAFRKSIYFFVGLVGTFFVNAFRIVGYFIVFLGQGQDAALSFHNIYGELFFFAWIFLYLLLILGVQRLRILEKVKLRFSKKNRDSKSKINPVQL